MSLIQNLSDWRTDRFLDVHNLKDGEIITNLNVLSKDVTEVLNVLHSVHDQLSAFPMSRERAAQAAREMDEGGQRFAQIVRLQSRLLLEFATRPKKDTQPKE